MPDIHTCDELNLACGPVHGQGGRPIEKAFKLRSASASTHSKHCTAGVLGSTGDVGLVVSNKATPTSSETKQFWLK